jgi:hypothetical protein
MDEERKHDTSPASEPNAGLSEREEEYRREYELQIWRMSCSGCGESPVF